MGVFGGRLNWGTAKFNTVMQQQWRPVSDAVTND